MSWVARTFVCLLTVFALAIASQVHAAVTLDDIFNAVQTSINRATAARDNAAIARDNAANATNRAIEARDNAANAVGRATEARDNAVTLVQGVAANATMVTADMQTAVSEAIEDMVREIAEENQGRAAFLAGGCPPCAPFRAQLVSLLGSLQTLANSPFVLTGMQATPVDLQLMINAVNALPDRALFPLYTMMTSQAGIMSPEIVAKFDETVGAVIAKILGKSFIAIGETNLVKGAGGDGWVGAHLHNNKRKSFGSILDGLGDVLLSFSSMIRSLVTRCEEVGMLTNLRQDLAGQHPAAPTAGSMAIGALVLAMLAAGGHVAARRRRAAEADARYAPAIERLD